MSSSTSQRRIQAILLRATVQNYSTWSLLVVCAPYAVPRTIPLVELPPELTIMRVLLRLRCRTCRARVETAALHNGVPG